MHMRRKGQDARLRTAGEQECEGKGEQFFCSHAEYAGSFRGSAKGSSLQQRSGATTTSQCRPRVLPLYSLRMADGEHLLATKKRAGRAGAL